jgi:hypothetical protein
MDTLNCGEWLGSVLESLRRDPLWDFQPYPKAMLLSDLVWEDTDQMMRDPRRREIAKQLIRSVGLICANIEEGHGRGFWQGECLFPAGGPGIDQRITGLVLSCPTFSGG